MTQNPETLDFKKIDYAPNWWKLKEPTGLFSIATKALHSIVFTPNLLQIEYTMYGETFLFPDFDNIFSRSSLAKEWWFLPPECEGKSIWQGEKEIKKGEKDFQNIYSESVLVELDKSRNQPGFFGLNSNCLVATLLSDLKYPPERGEVDDEDSCFSKCYYYDFFQKHSIEHCWHWWLLSMATIDYYHTMFSFSVNPRQIKREVDRLYHRFPEYAQATGDLTSFHEHLNKNLKKIDVDKFFDMQSTDTNRKLQKDGMDSKKIPPISFCQCRVCGVILCTTKRGIGKKGNSKSKQICSSSDCKRALERFKKRLAPTTKDETSKIILLSQL
jgi:hypothetical protein